MENDKQRRGPAGVPSSLAAAALAARYSANPPHDEKVVPRQLPSKPTRTHLFLYGLAGMTALAALGSLVAYTSWFSARAKSTGESKTTPIGITIAQLLQVDGNQVAGVIGRKVNGFGNVWSVSADDDKPGQYVVQVNCRMEPAPDQGPF